MTGQDPTRQPGSDAVVPDPHPVVDELRHRLAEEREVALNAVDAVLGAQAETAQIRAENRELLYRLHVRETELEQAKALLRITDDEFEGSTGLQPAEGEAGSDRVELASAARSLVRAARHTVRRS